LVGAVDGGFAVGEVSKKASKRFFFEKKEAKNFWIGAVSPKEARQHIAVWTRPAAQKKLGGMTVPK
jgi:hypothetical protein